MKGKHTLARSAMARRETVEVWRSVVPTGDARLGEGQYSINSRCGIQRNTNSSRGGQQENLESQRSASEHQMYSEKGKTTGRTGTKRDALQPVRHPGTLPTLLHGQVGGNLPGHFHRRRTLILATTELCGLVVRPP